MWLIHLLPLAAPGALGATTPMNPDLAIITDVALAGFTADEPMQSGGHDPTTNGFNLQQVELSLGGAVDPYFRYDGNLVFSAFGVEVEEAFATTLALPARLQVRAGQLLTRFGRHNPTHPHSWAFVDQPFPIGRVFGGEGNRGLGVEASWLAPLPWSVELVVSETMAGGESTARSFYGATDLGVSSPQDLQGTAALKQFFPLGTDTSLAWGLSFATGPNATGRANRTEIYGTDLFLKYRPLSGGRSTVVSLEGEALWRRRQVPEDVLADWSAFSQVQWRFLPRWGVAGRHEWGSPARGLDGEVADDPLDPTWTADRHRAAAALTFWPTEFSRLRLQGSADLGGWLETPEYAAFLALEVSAGAHGAHAF